MGDVGSYLVNGRLNGGCSGGDGDPGCSLHGAGGCAPGAWPAATLGVAEGSSGSGDSGAGQERYGMMLVAVQFMWYGLLERC